MKRIKINFTALGIYLFGFIIIYLAAMSMSGILLYIFIIYILFPVVSFIFLIISLIKFRYHENFNTEHPVKGDEIIYNLSLSNESPFTFAFVQIKFKKLNDFIIKKLPDINKCLRWKENYKNDFHIKCPYRGVYNVGIEKIKMQDVLGWVKFFPNVWYRTFYVYPRIIELNNIFEDLRSSIESSGDNTGIVYDNTLLLDISKYKEGQSIKNMAWKKFITTGEPYSKRYEKSSWPGLNIYIDLRRNEELSHNILIREDCSVEIMVSLVNYFFKKNVPVGVHGFNGQDRYDYNSNENYLFKDFYNSTLYLSFKDSYSPFSLFKSDLFERQLNFKTIIFITHILDPEMIEICSKAKESNLSVFIILNQTGINIFSNEHINNYINNVEKLNSKIIIIDDSDKIKEILENY